MCAGAVLSVCASSAGAQPLAAGASCSAQPTVFNQKSINSNKQTSAAVFCAGPATQDVWATIVNNGPVIVPFACPSTTSAFNCSYTSGYSNNWSVAVNSGDLATFEVPAGDYLSLNPAIGVSGFDDELDYGATVINVTPVSGGPALAVGQQCSGANFIPASINCLWSGQLGTVTQNSWVTFDNTGTTQAKLDYAGLSGSSDSLTLAPGQLGYIGLGAGHATSSSELQLQQQEATRSVCLPSCVAPTPANPPSLVRVNNLVPQNFAGFTLMNSGQCQTTSFNVNPVNCAESGQMGVLDEQASLELLNSSNFVNSVKVTGSNGGGSVTVPPGQDGVVTLDSGSQVIVQCLQPTGSSCPTGAPAEVSVDAVVGAVNAATLSTATVAGGGRRVRAPLRCAARRRRRCEGTITLSFPRRGRGTGATVYKGTFNLVARGKKVIPLLGAGRLRNGVGELTVRTREPNGKSVITDQRVVKLKR